MLEVDGAEPTLSVVIPAYNAELQLPQVLKALLPIAGDCPIVVVDPGSTDRTAELAEKMGTRVLRLGHRAGPAEARNAGVELVDTEIVLFIDSDCVPDSQVIKRVKQAFAKDPHLASMTGSYDANPADPGFFSGYMNLRHHFTHQNAAQEDATFWAGCGAVNREAFRAVGGFNAERFPMPQIEDIELGMRLSQKGRTILDPDLNVKHLKRWTLQSVVSTDIFQRAVPWSRLIQEQGDLPNDLNLRLSQRIAAALAPLVLLSMVALPAAAFLGQWLMAGVAALILATSFSMHLPMVRCFAESRGIAFALGGWAFQQIHLLYSAATFVACRILP